MSLSVLSTVSMKWTLNGMYDFLNKYQMIVQDWQNNQHQSPKSHTSAATWNRISDTTFYGQLHSSGLTYTHPLLTCSMTGRTIMISLDIPRDSWHISHCRRMDPGCTVSPHSVPKGVLLAWGHIFASLSHTYPKVTGMEIERAALSMSNLGIQKL